MYGWLRWQGSKWTGGYRTGDELHDSGITRGENGCCVAGMGQDLAVGRLRHIVSGALQRRGPSSGNPMGSMEGACGVNAESENAEYSAEHHFSGKGCERT